MPEIQAAVSLPWRDGAAVQAAVSLPWIDGAAVQSIGTAYTPPAVGGGVVITPGSLAPKRDILAAVSYAQQMVLAVTDLRNGAALPVTSVTIDLPDGSDLWTLQAQGSAALGDAIRAGAQPATVQVSVGTDAWRFVIETIDQPLTFENRTVTLRGRSLASAAGAPYQAQQTYITDAPTSAAQICALANTFTGVSIDWRASNWLIPAGAWSATTDPLGAVRQIAGAVLADVEAHPTAMSVSVRSRYGTAPNTWATQAPDVQIAWAAFEAASQERADQPEYDSVLVAGMQSGGVLQAHLAGTSGSTQAPMVTDVLLTDLPAQTERAAALLYSFGGRARESRTLQMHGAVVKRGSLVRCVEPAATWTGCVRAVSVQATLAKARQTIVMERPMSFVLGTSVPDAVPAPPGPLEFFATQGPKQNLSDSTPPTLSTDMTSKRVAFLAAITELGRANYEGTSSTAFTYTGGSASITSGSAINKNGDSSGTDLSLGRYNMTPDLPPDPITLDPTFGRWIESSVSFTYTFSTAISALGFYGTDFGDFDGTFVIELFNGPTSIYSRALANTTGTNGNLLFFGVATQTDFTSAKFTITQAGGPADILGFDVLILGRKL